jgi:hypothetical protein
MTLNEIEKPAVDESAEQRLNELFKEVLERVGDKGIAASSFGKYDGIREWLGSKLGLQDWKRDTYATGASTTAHNFGSRWSQSNQVSGDHSNRCFKCARSLNMGRCKTTVIF